MTRRADFDLSLETATPATSSDPSADSDLVNKGFGDNNYMQGGRAVADVAALKAITAANRHDNDIRLVDSLNALFKFDSASSETGDDSTVITPDAGTGRWLITTSSGSGSGGGSRNYLQDLGSDNAENNIGDWVTYADTAGTTPVDGTGGLTEEVTFTRNTTTPLRQTADFRLTKNSADRQGEGASVDFVVDIADRNKVLGIWFDVDATDANYADDDLQVFIYDKDTSTLITPYSPSGAHKIKGNKYRFRCAFSPANTLSANYRLIIHVASTNATTYSVYFDNFEVGPGNNLQYGFDGIWKTYDHGTVAVTSSQTGWAVVSGANWFTPFKDSQGQWYLEFNIQGTYTAATIGSGGVTVTIPGVTFDSDQAVAGVLGSTTNNTLRGAFAASGSGNVIVRPLSTSTTTVFYANGRVKLTGKPTWADFDPIATVYPTTDDLAVTPSENFTPTGTWNTNTTYSGMKNRLFGGLVMNVRASLAGAPDAVEFKLDLPAGLTAFNPTGSNKRVGIAYIYDNGTVANRKEASVTVASGATQLSFTMSEGGVVNATNPFTWASGDLIDIWVIVPITQWQNPGALSPIGLEMAGENRPGLVSKGVAVTDTTDVSDTATKLNSLLQSLRDAGIITD